MANYLSPFATRQFVDANGNPYSGAKLFTYVAGSTTKVTTYKDSAGSSSHTNPIILNTRGEPADGSGVSYPIWQIGGAAVKFVLAPSTDTDPPASPISTWDNISGVNDTSITISEWIAGPTPTYINATSFTLAGDQTSTFHIGRRLKTTNTSGTIYSTISNSVYGASTTVTITNDSGTLDSGLSSVSYGIISFSNTSDPLPKANTTYTGNNTFSGTTTLSGTNTLSGSTTISGALSVTNSAAFTNSPTAPTPANGDNSTKVATTAFVNTSIVTQIPIQGTRLFGIESQAQNTTYYIGENGIAATAQTADTTETQVQWIASKYITIRDLYVFASSAPPAGQTVTITLRKNAADTALTAQITSSGGVVSDTSHTVTGVPGDRFSIKSVTSATTGTMNVSVSIRFTDAFSGYGISHFVFAEEENNANATGLLGVVGGSVIPSTATEPYTFPVVHSNCFMNYFHAQTTGTGSHSLSVGTTSATTVGYINGSGPNLGTTGSGSQISYPGLYYPLTSSSYYRMQIAAQAGNNPHYGSWGLVQRTTGADNQIMPMYFTSRQQAQNTTLYMGGHGCAGNATEATKQTPITAGTLKNFILMNEGTGVGGQSWTANVRVDGVTQVTLTLSGTTTVATDTSTSVTVTAGQKVSVQVISSATTGTRDIQFAMDHLS